jgi:hypothetical protein
MLLVFSRQQLCIDMYSKYLLKDNSQACSLMLDIATQRKADIISSVLYNQME